MGWSKAMQEKFPHSWEKVRSALKESKRNKGHKQSDYQKQRAREVNLGSARTLGKTWKWSDDAKKRIIGTKAIRLGMKSSEETKQKQSKSLKGWTSRISEDKKVIWKSKISIARSKQILPIQDTSIELAIQNELYSRGIKFEKHKNITGLPDIFIEPNICIFADGDYWHANPEKSDIEKKIRFSNKLLSASEIWEKDKKVTDKLTTSGYVVYRFWECDIKKDVKACVDKILSIDKTQQNK